jgi:quercetin dioxygenase-like cupin family protein
MAKEKTIKGVPVRLEPEVGYADGSVVSKTLYQKTTGSLTLFSFDAGQGLSEHTSPYDAHVHILDGEAELVIGGKSVIAHAGELVTMPANVPHSLKANQRFKMMLIMIR